MSKWEKLAIICAVATVIVVGCVSTYVLSHLGSDGHIYGDTASGLGHSVDFQPHYYAPGSNYAGKCGAPDGVYEQKDWGFPDSVEYPCEGGWVTNATEIFFAMCDHSYLGPLHGSWKVTNGTWIPIWHKGVFPVDARLIITLKDNIIIDASVKSHLVYGN